MDISNIFFGNRNNVSGRAHVVNKLFPRHYSMFVEKGRVVSKYLIIYLFHLKRKYAL